MAASTVQAEAIKLIGDWCKLLVTIETAAIAAIAAFLKLDNGQVLTDTFRYSSATTLFTFAFSIALTAWIMVSLPTSIQDIQPNESIWDRPAIAFNIHVPLWICAYLQLGLFVTGVFAFAFGATTRLWLVQMPAPQ